MKIKLILVMLIKILLIKLIILNVFLKIISEMILVVGKKRHSENSSSWFYIEIISVSKWLGFMMLRIEVSCSIWR